MRVDKAGQYHLPLRIQGWLIRVSTAQRCGCADSHDRFALDQHRAIRNDPQAAQIAPALRPAGQCKQL